jgi:hypothetical protein
MRQFAESRVVWLTGTEKVPAIPSDISKYGDFTVRFSSRRRYELDARGDHPLVVRSEVVYAKKEADSTTMLVANDIALLLAVCPSQQQAGLRARRSHYYPPFGSAIVGRGRRVFHQLELQDVDKEPDRGLILMNEDGDQLN